MPIFEYICEKCGNQFERLQRAEQPEGRGCPKCGSSDIKRQLSSFSSNAGGSSSGTCFSGG